jgi:ATP-dependent DNA helicase RecG
MTAELAPLTVLKGVGPGVAARLSALHLHTLQDLLFHLPLRYQDRTRISPIAASRIGSELLLEGQVLGCEITFGRRRSLLCRIKDATGIITLRFYHFSAAQKNALTPGVLVRCYGEVRGGKTGPELYHPEYQVLRSEVAAPLESRLTPVYPVTEGLQQARLRSLVDQALTLLTDST